MHKQYLHILPWPKRIFFVCLDSWSMQMPKAVEKKKKNFEFQAVSGVSSTQLATCYFSLNFEFGAVFNLNSFLQ
jgi:hypothetical protein